HFYDSKHRAQIIKSPVQLVAQTIRTFRTPPRSYASLVSAADLMGQQLFQPPNVKGWEGGRSWINTSTYFVRQNLAIYLLTGKRAEHLEWDANDEPFDATHLVADLKRTDGSPVDPRDLAAYLLRISLANEPDEARVVTIADFLKSTVGAPENDRIVG